MSTDELRIVRSETPVKEIWSRLSYFESEHNAREFWRSSVCQTTMRAHYSFFLLVNIVGAIIEYWIGKSTILGRLFKT